MHEIELKAHLAHPEKTEALLSRIADFSFHCVKTDRYWTLGEKTIRVRRELVANKETRRPYRYLPKCSKASV